MDVEENPFEHIQRFFKEFKGEINIIDDQIDIGLQMAYFEKARELRNASPLTNWEVQVPKLNNTEVSISEKQELLIKLAVIEDVKVYRVLEAFAKEADETIRHWAALALQESNMLLHSKLLEESQVFISTGLGGKGNKLRYFMVLFNKNNEPFSELQQKVVKSEFEYTFKKNNSEIEEIKFFDNNASLVALVPLDIPVQNLFVNALNECNVFGDFIRENCIITNVRKMNPTEIREFLEKNNE